MKICKIRKGRDFGDLLPSSHPGFSSRDAESWQHCQRDSKSILAVRESGLSQSLQRDITARRKILGTQVLRRIDDLIPIIAGNAIAARYSTSSDLLRSSTLNVSFESIEARGRGKKEKGQKRK